MHPHRAEIMCTQEGGLLQAREREASGETRSADLLDLGLSASRMVEKYISMV